jgi:hypothetical protein
VILRRRTVRLEVERQSLALRTTPARCPVCGADLASHPEPESAVTQPPNGLSSGEADAAMHDAQTTDD